MSATRTFENGDRNVACIDCGDDFKLRPGEIDFYVQKGLDLPKRCKRCRDAKRARNQAA